MKKLGSLLLVLVLAASLLTVLPSLAAEAYTDASSWTIKASSDGIGGIRGAFDNNPKSYWHTTYHVTNGSISDKDLPPYTIDITFPDAREVTGIRYMPRQINGSDNSSAGIWSKAEIYTSENGSDFYLSATATFDLVATRATVDVPIKKGTYKALRIKVTEAAGSFGTAAEISVLKGDVTVSKGATSTLSDGTVKDSSATTSAASSSGASTTTSAASSGAEAYTDASGWTISACSDGMGGIRGAFDNNPKSYWHTSYTVVDGKIVDKDDVPHTIDIIFPDSREVTGIRYIPRTDESSAGIWLKAEIYTSTDGTTFQQAATATFNANSLTVKRETAEVAIPKGTYKALRIKITESQSGFGTAAEIKVLHGAAANTANVTTTLGGDKTEVKEEPKPVDTEGKLNTSYITGKKNWKITASSCASFTSPQAMLDDNAKTFWHTNYTASGSTITSSDPPPYYIDITMDQAIEAAGFSYLTRPDNTSGIWLECKVFASDTDEGELIPIATYTYDMHNGRKTRFFSANIKIKRVHLEVMTKAHGTCAEIDFVAPFDASYKTLTPGEYPAYEEAHGMVKIPLENAGIKANVDPWVDNYPVMMIDGTARYWQTATEASAPFIVDLTLPFTYSIARFDMTPRQTSDWHGTWERYNVYASTDGEHYTLVAKDLSNAKTLNTKVYVFEEPVTASALRFEILEGYTNKAACQELELYETAEGHAARKAASSERYVLTVDKNEIKVKKGSDEKTVALDVAPYIAGGTTLIPLRGLFEEMGATVTWRDEDQTVIVKKDAKIITLQIWNNLVTVEGTKYGTVRYTLLQYPRITENRTFIPLRFISEHLGYNVEWNGDTREITIASPEVE